MSASTRWLLGVGLAVVAMAVASVLVVTLGRPGQEALPEDTPEGVVQRYLQALREGDTRAAHALLSARLQERCTYDSLRTSTRWLRDSDSRMTLQEARVTDGEAEVEVRVTQYYLNPPFGGGESSYTERFSLAMEDGAWRLSEPPWPLGWCPEPTPVSR